MTLERCLNCRRVAFVIALADGCTAYCLWCRTTFHVVDHAKSRATA